MHSSITSQLREVKNEKESKIMKKVFALALTVLMVMSMFAGCGSSNNGGSDTASVDVRNAKTIADLKGAKIAAQAGTFHADALSQRSDDLMGVGLF